MIIVLTLLGSSWFALAGEPAADASGIASLTLHPQVRSEAPAKTRPESVEKPQKGDQQR
jgi:hypothetical protein